MNGMIPPPTTIVMKIPDAFAVYFPRPSVARLKIPPHITDVQRPQRKMNTQDNGTLASVMVINPKSRLSVVSILPVNMAATIRTIPTEDTVISWVRVDTFPEIAVLVARPTSISSQ